MRGVVTPYGDEGTEEWQEIMKQCHEVKVIWKYPARRGRASITKRTINSDSTVNTYYEIIGR
jgi:hypothetical protein